LSNCDDRDYHQCHQDEILLHSVNQGDKPHFKVRVGGVVYIISLSPKYKDNLKNYKKFIFYLSLTSIYKTSKKNKKIKIFGFKLRRK
jgi:hypothetical protein